MTCGNTTEVFRNGLGSLVILLWKRPHQIHSTALLYFLLQDLEPMFGQTKIIIFGYMVGATDLPPLAVIFFLHHRNRKFSSCLTFGNSTLQHIIGRGSAVTETIPVSLFFVDTATMARSVTIFLSIAFTPGVASNETRPGSKGMSVHWTGKDGNFYMYGGNGYAEIDYGSGNALP
jgi:hypothetical protein